MSTGHYVAIAIVVLVVLLLAFARARPERPGGVPAAAPAPPARQENAREDEAAAQAPELQQLRAQLASAGVDVSRFGAFLLGDTPVPYVAVRGDKAVATWEKLRGLVERTQRWPLLLGGRELLDPLRESAGQEPVADVLREAEQAGHDPLVWAERRRRETEALLRDAGMNVDLGSEENPGTDETVPDDVEPADSYTIPYDVLTRRPLPEVLVALLGSPVPWHAPAILRFGDWNECPAPAQHAALWRHWHERYGAEPVGLAHDVVEFRVARPPATRAQALELARAQYAYCADIVDQGVGTVGALAATLQGARIWYFWWD